MYTPYIYPSKLLYLVFTHVFRAISRSTRLRSMQYVVPVPAVERMEKTSVFLDDGGDFFLSFFSGGPGTEIARHLKLVYDS